MFHSTLVCNTCMRWRMHVQSRREFASHSEIYILKTILLRWSFCDCAYARAIWYVRFRLYCAWVWYNNPSTHSTNALLLYNYKPDECSTMLFTRGTDCNGELKKKQATSERHTFIYGNDNMHIIHFGFWLVPTTSTLLSKCHTIVCVSNGVVRTQSNSHFGS